LNTTNSDGGGRQALEAAKADRPLASTKSDAAHIAIEEPAAAHESVDAQHPHLFHLAASRQVLSRGEHFKARRRRTGRFYRDSAARSISLA
jgi:hypothetical protein